MERVDGKSFDQIIAPQGMPLAQVFDIAIPMADDEETALATATAALTGEGVVMGTAPYMSPKQLSGEVIDSRTDTSSLGIVLYEMVTGQRPFQGESGIELASSILKDAPSPGE